MSDVELYGHWYAAGRWFHNELHSQIPNGAVFVPQEDYELISHARIAGATILPDRNGFPRIHEQAAPEIAEPAVLPSIELPAAVETESEPEVLAPKRYYYSAKASAFHHTNDTYSLPEDAVEIEDEHHAALIEAVAQGKTIIPDADGLPTAIAMDLGRARKMQALALRHAAQRHLNHYARERGFVEMTELCSYALSSVERYSLEAAKAIAWRDKIRLLLDEALDRPELPLVNTFLDSLPGVS